MKKTNHWRMRRVAFMVSDDHHVIRNVVVKMPVRVKERTDDKTVYEGPIASKWAEVEKMIGPPPDVFTSNLHLVGVLYASDESLEFGRIDWLVQSEISVVEAGAEYEMG